MSKIHSTNSGEANKPAKPYPNFPFFPHPNGIWAKKIRGKVFYFGPWANPDAALEKYLRDQDFLHSGRKPRVDSGELTIKDMCNSFLNAKSQLRGQGEITARTWNDYKDMCDLLIEHFGKTRIVADLLPDDFAELRNKMAKNWNPTTLGNRIQRIRVIFNFAVDNAMVNKTIPFGQGFKRPSKKNLRLERAKKGPRMFEAEELKKVLEVADQPLKSMILLGINCGFGNNDCGTLPLSALDLEKGWLNYHRPKTGINRRCPLWPETINALKDWLGKRPKPKTDAFLELVFITKYRDTWAKQTSDTPICYGRFKTSQVAKVHY